MSSLVMVAQPPDTPADREVNPGGGGGSAPVGGGTLILLGLAFAYAVNRIKSNQHQDENLTYK